MVKTWVLFGILGALWAALYIWSDYTESGKIDYCMDAGGAWNYELKTCEGARPGYKES
jgi:hypothetical protein